MLEILWKTLSAISAPTISVSSRIEFNLRRTKFNLRGTKFNLLARFLPTPSSSLAFQSSPRDKSLDILNIFAHFCFNDIRIVTLDLIAYIDGGSHGNPGPSGIGVVLMDSTGSKVTVAKWIGRQDNNVAEYVALLECLQRAVELKAHRLRVYSDSQLVV